MYIKQHKFLKESMCVTAVYAELSTKEHIGIDKAY